MSEAIKFCKHCRWLQKRLNDSAAFTCTHPKAAEFSSNDLIFAPTRSRCADIRRDESLCGPTAQWWQEQNRERMADKRKPARNIECRQGVMYGRIRVKGKLHRWSLGTRDIEIAKTRVKEDIERIISETFYDHPRHMLERRKWRNWPTLDELHEPPRSRRGYVYIIGFSDYVKIGWSMTVKSRLLSLQTAVPERIVVYGLIEGERNEESALHDRFRDCRLNGEWFRIDHRLQRWIEEGCWAQSNLLMKSHNGSQQRLSGSEDREESVL